MKKKLLAMLLSAAMILGVTACGTKNTVNENESAAKPSSEAAVEESKTEVKGDPAELRLIMYGALNERKEEFFKTDFKERILEELNIDLEVEFLAWGAMTADVQNRLMAGEKFAYMHIPKDSTHGEKGLCAEISEEDINTYLPDLVKMRGNNGFDACKYKDQIIAVPMGNKIYSGAYRCVTVLNNVLNEVGWDYTDIKTYEDLVEAALAVKKEYPDMRLFSEPVAILGAAVNLFADGPMSSTASYPTSGYYFVLEDEAGDKIHSMYESEEFKKAIRLAQEMHELGLSGDDLLSDPSASANDWSVGNCLVAQGVAGNLVETGLKAKMPEGTDLRVIKLNDYTNIYTLDYDWAFSVSVAAQDDVPDYLRLLNWIYASEDNYRFCIYGVEGKDWEYNADGTINAKSGTMFADWFLQASCYHIYDPSIPEEAIAAYEAWDDGAKQSKLAGFTFDATNVMTELGAMDAITTEKIPPLVAGYGDVDKELPAIVEELKKAGLDKYMEELQKQYSAWYAENR